jgi:hypothetical protein
MPATNTHYPVTEQYNGVQSAKKWVPSLLRTFMEQVVSDDLKQASLAHAIVQAARPRSVISPVLFGVGIGFDNKFGSKSLLTCLARLGFSISYDEDTRFKQCVAQNVDNVLPPSFLISFTQWSGDNVDHTAH